MSVYLDFYRFVTRLDPRNEQTANIPNYDFSKIIQNLASIHFEDAELAEHHAKVENLYVIGDEWIHNNKDSSFAFCWELDSHKVVVCVHQNKGSCWIKDGDGAWELLDADEAKKEAEESTIAFYTRPVSYFAGLLATRRVEYVEDTGTDITRINQARTARSKPLLNAPRIIKLNETVKIREKVGSTNSGRSLNYEHFVSSFVRHFKNPIKSGPNAGKTEVIVKAHKRGLGKPSRPYTAEALQYKVVM